MFAAYSLFEARSAPAARSLVRGIRRPRILGVRVPDPKKLAAGVDLKQVAKLIGNVAEQVEARSDDVRILSGQASDSAASCPEAAAGPASAVTQRSSQKTSVSSSLGSARQWP
jgi:hypothetical protein